VYVSHRESSFILEGGTITGNKAEKSGSIFLYGGNAELKGGLVGGNTAEYGGGVYMTNGAQVTMYDSVQIGGNSADWGGGVYINHEECSLVIEGGNVHGNTARSGGGVYNRYAGTLALNGGTVQENSPDDVFKDW
jgi:hypothetical protein